MSKLLTLDQANDYRAFLDTYQPGGQTIYNFARSKFGVIAGPTGAGKDTIRNALMQQSSDFISILSTTTRPPREGEQDGVEYHFRDLDFIEQGFDEQRFLQAEVIHNQQISCLDIAEIERLNDQQIGLGILLVQTEVKLRALNRDLRTVFVVPPSLSVLYERIQAGRGLADDELVRRMDAAKVEFQFALKQPSYFCILNDEVDRATTLAHDFFKDGAFDSAEDTKTREIIGQILNEMETRQNV